ncbi:hypothetical protein M0R45_018870 [Rubus argutus]|uniref:Uncharacterized protein n=1 Tax=Rubus argutus TaxID=59490 RepID=A0AAW1X3Y0_RUBAR
MTSSLLHSRKGSRAGVYSTSCKLLPCPALHKLHRTAATTVSPEPKDVLLLTKSAQPSRRYRHCPHRCLLAPPPALSPLGAALYISLCALKRRNIKV